jgi:acetolactate synthase-1/2/3 large subunit
VQIDADPTQGGRNYPVDLFISGDARLALEGLAARLPELPALDESFADEVARARASAEQGLCARLRPYRIVADILRDRVSSGRHPFVRDVTVANSTFGNRYVEIAAPNLGIHAAGGGIGQGVAMAIGAALSAPSRKTVALLGDGGTVVNLGELLTAVQEKAEVVFVLMNDLGYGVIRNIQDAQYRGRRSYADLHTPDFAMLAASFGLPHAKVTAVDAFEAAFDRALAARGPFLLEIDMTAIGPYAEPFGGPPAGAAGKAG